MLHQSKERAHYKKKTEKSTVKLFPCTSTNNREYRLKKKEWCANSKKDYHTKKNELPPCQQYI